MSAPDSSYRASVERAVRSVTDLWDEPLDEVHDVPPIVNAIMAEVVAPLLARAAEAEAAVERVRQVLVQHERSPLPYSTGVNDYRPYDVPIPPSRIRAALARPEQDGA